MAIELGFELVNFGFGNILVYHAGMPDWLEANYPVESGGTNEKIK